MSYRYIHEYQPVSLKTGGINSNKEKEMSIGIKINKVPICPIKFIRTNTSHDRYDYQIVTD